MTGRITVVSGNLHNHKAAVKWLRDRSRPSRPGHYDAALVSEAHKRAPSLARFTGHDYHTGDTPGPAQETGILLSRRLRDLGGGSYYLSPATPAGEWDMIGQERWGQERVTDVDGTPVALINAHPVPGRYALRGNDPDHPLVQRYAAAMRWVDLTIGKHIALGHRVIVGGDWQMREGERFPWSPRTMFDRRDMAYYWHGIDVIAWTRPTVVVSSHTHEGFPSDHPALRVVLDMTGRKR